MTDFKTSDRDVNRAIRSWLHEDRHEDVSRIAGAVLDQVDTIPQRRATWWPARRTPTMNKIAGIGLAAAAVVAAVFIGAQLLGSPSNVGGPGDEPTPSVTAEPTPQPTPQPTPEGLLSEGPHMILTGQGVDRTQQISPPLTVTIPAPDWYGEVGGGELSKNGKHEPPDGAGMIIFVKSEYIVYGDACHWETTVPDAPVTTVDEFVAALASQASRDASEPVDITLGGYAGKSITLEVPDDVDFSKCDPGYGGSWDCGDDGMTPCGYHSGAGEIDTVYILDVDGVIMAWNTKHYAGTPAEDVAELEAIVQSASFGE
jgi:hypothetical protein